MNGFKTESIAGGIFIMMMSHLASAHETILDHIKPTGSWYTEITIDINKFGSCLLDYNYVDYKDLYPSFNAAKKAMFDKEYKGGVCEETMRPGHFAPTGWPLSYDLWDQLIQLHPGFPKETHFSFDCENTMGDYFFDFNLQPQYNCSNTSCTHYVKACPGDIYAGDLLQKPIELLGHTGVIFDSINNIIDKSLIVLEVLKTPPIIHFDKALIEIEKERPIWGVRYGHGKLTNDGEMTYLEAVSISEEGFIQSHFCPQYTTLPIYKVGGYGLNSNNLSGGNNNAFKCGVFRCDTFVQYLYKKVLNAQLPPQSPLHMPKDLFDAIPNQRGENVSFPLNKKEWKDKNPLPVGSENLWHAYQKKKLSDAQSELALDSIDSFHTISFKSLLLAINKENNQANKAKLLFILFNKISEEKPKDEFNRIKAAVLTLIREEKNSIVLTNALILSPNLLSQAEIINEIKALILRGNSFPKDDLTLIKKTINLVLFDVFSHSDSEDIIKEVYSLFSILDSESVLESLSVFINSMPENGLTTIHKSYLCKLLRHPKLGFLHTQNFFITHFRIKAWSSALIKIKPETLSNTDMLYESVKPIKDLFVISLLVDINREQISTSSDKERFLKILLPLKLLKESAKQSALERGIKAHTLLFLSESKNSKQN
jgi:hypothetical protein